MKYQLIKGAVNVTIEIFIQDSSSTIGAGLTGLVFNSAGLTCYYARPLAVAAQLTLATQTVTGAHSDGGFVEIDATNMPGWYRLDLSDAVLATGVDSVGVHLKGATNMAPLPLEIQLTSIDLNDAVRGGMTAMPNADVNDAGGLVTSAGGATGIDDLALASSIAALNNIAATDIVTAGAITTSSGAVVNVTTVATTTTNSDMRGTDNALLAANVPTNFADMAITVTTGKVTIGTNDDKTGYDLNADQSGVTIGTLTGQTPQTGDSYLLLTGAQAEPTGVPAVNETPMVKLGYMFAALRNKVTTTATEKQFYDDADAPMWEKTLNDDGTTYTEGEGSTP